MQKQVIGLGPQVPLPVLIEEEATRSIFGKPPSLGEPPLRHCVSALSSPLGKCCAAPSTPSKSLHPCRIMSYPPAETQKNAVVMPSTCSR